MTGVGQQGEVAKGCFGEVRFTEVKFGGTVAMAKAD